MNPTATNSGTAVASPAPTSLTPAPAPAPAPKSNRWYLSSAPVLVAVLHLALPLAAAFVVNALHNVINAGFLGAQNDLTLIAAVTFGTPVLGLTMAIGSLFGVGGGALVSRLLGASEKQGGAAGSADSVIALGNDLRNASSFSFWGAAGTGLIVGVIGLLLINPLVAGLGATGSAVAPTAIYVGVLLAFLPIITAAQSLEQLVRAEGAARVAMLGLMIMTGTTLVLDAVFILVFHWGVAGVAVSMGIANLVAIGYWALWIRRSAPSISLSPRWFTLARKTTGPVLSIGAGVLLQSAFMIVTSLLFNNLAAPYGSDPLAAMGVALRIAQVPEFLILGISMGVMPLLAYAYGRGDGERLRKAMRVSLLLAVGLGVVFTGVFLLFRAPLLHIFLGDPSLLALGSTIILAQLVAMIANSASGLIITYFQATGRALPSIIMSSAQGVLFIPVVVVANIIYGLPGLIWALTAAEIAVLVTGVVMWLGTRRAIARGLAEGSEERAEAALEEQAA